MLCDWLCNSVHSITDLVFKNALSADTGVGLNASVLPCWQHSYLLGFQFPVCCWMPNHLIFNRGLVLLKSEEY